MKMQPTRRHFLKGLGLAVALPAMESLMPGTAQAATAAKTATTAAGDPLRSAFLYVPNGVNVEKWFPTGTGKDYKLNATMQPLEGLRGDFQVVSGLAHQHGFAGKDGAGDHARAHASFLTGARPKKTAGSDIEVGISIDQEMAKSLGHETRLPSLELSCDGARKSGSCDSGYSCAYQFNLSWRSPNTPMAAESNPRLVFERLFGRGNGDERQRNFDQRMAERRSVLDFVMGETKTMSKQLGRNDVKKLDEYLTGVREIEQRIQNAEKFRDLPEAAMDAPSGIPKEYADHMRLMFDLLALSFQTDSTRVASFMLAHDGSNRSFREIGVSEGHHSLSHHKNEKETLEKIAKVDHFYVTQLAYFLEKLKSLKDPSGASVLDNSMIVYGSGLCDGNRHNHDNLPVILAGKGGGTFETGRHVQLDVKQRTPMSNLFVTMMDRMGIREPEFGDSTGPLTVI
ncbi:hypothetical protein C5Y96_03705 [Blastopirellula marina]|uniref:DUF1552 domain-containing protein n=1 Tax=Blastopirellula marina TaxID=124 RepID=A0A2S8G3H4_9BACT|nr:MULTISPECIES: DUF1552 domain-containing protein [Pirellulaceae]PQO38987.1 hypothetical protein C5Y96_03705 [Blastopirellula marina]RCS55295.1 DUF1552 domain-containing protein [Bremerella cremea]